MQDTNLRYIRIPIHINNILSNGHPNGIRNRFHLPNGCRGQGHHSINGPHSANTSGCCHGHGVNRCLSRCFYRCGYWCVHTLNGDPVFILGISARLFRAPFSYFCATFCASLSALSSALSLFSVNQKRETDDEKNYAKNYQSDGITNTPPLYAFCREILNIV